VKFQVNDILLRRRASHFIANRFAIEPLLQGAQVLALCRDAATQPLSECLKSVNTAAGHHRVAEFLQGQPWPHYEPHPRQAGLLVRIEADGKRTTGRFVNRRFELVKAKPERR
jgi:hypothetical protein